MNSASDCCNYLYAQARHAPGRNSVIDSNGKRVVVVQDLADADAIMRRKMAIYEKRMHWFARVAGNSRLTDDGAAWRFRWGLSQPFLSKYDPQRAQSVCLFHARQLTRALADAPGQRLNEKRIHESVISVFTQMFLEIELQDIPMAHDSASRLIELASVYAFTAPGAERSVYKQEDIRDIFYWRKHVFDALQHLRHLPEPAPLLQKLLDAESVDGFDFRFEKELITLFGAASDTTSYSLGWAAHLLASFPALQARLQASVDGIYARHADDEHALCDALQACGDLKFFVAELLRLYPPLPFVTRVALQDDRLSDTEVHAEDVVLVSLVGVNQKGLRRDDPWVPDIDAATREGVGLGTGVQSSFTWGPRVCGGRSFALLELNIVLGELIHRLSFRAMEEAPMEYEWVGQMRRLGGHRVEVFPRGSHT